MQCSKEDFIKLIESFVTGHCLAVLATVKPTGEPEAACVEFVVLGELRLGFCTLTSYRKYDYLQKNPNVAIVFGGQSNVTVQYEGRVAEVGKNSEVRSSIESTFGNDFVSLPEARFFEITPTWIRYSDFKDNKESNFDIQEMKF
jgi:uncharacterized pyridoxamine 5'-phosphate oxidase family protein